MKKQTIFIVVTVLFAIVVLVVVLLQNPNQVPGLPNIINQEPKSSQPLEDGSINVQVGVSKTSYSYGEKVKFHSIVENISAQPEKFMFSTTCQGGTLFINDQPTQQSQLCGQAFTEVNLKPAEKVTYDYEFDLVQEFSRELEGDYVEFDGELVLNPGEHEAYLDWQGVRSNAVSFTVVD